MFNGVTVPTKNTMARKFRSRSSRLVFFWEEPSGSNILNRRMISTPSHVMTKCTLQKAAGNPKLTFVKHSLLMKVTAMVEKKLNARKDICFASLLRWMSYRLMSVRNRFS